jgi:1-acyl-sn-glycerol-3-phosphate acyltransferase
MITVGVWGIIPYFFGRKYAYISFFFFRTWSYLFGKVAFIDYRIYRTERVPRDRSFIFISNHSSYLDAPAILIKTRWSYVPLGKKELAKIPVLGTVFSNAAILVNRSSEESRKESVALMKNLLQTGISILVFPEGTQNRTNQPLAPFYNGAFRMAIETQTNIYPLVVINSGKLMPPKRFYIRPGIVKVVYGEEYSVQGKTMDDLPQIKEELRAQMIALMENNPVK